MDGPLGTPSLLGVPLDLSELCAFSGTMGCVGLGPEWIICLDGAAAITRDGSVTAPAPGFCEQARANPGLYAATPLGLKDKSDLFSYVFVVGHPS